MLKKQISPKIVALVFGIIVICFAVAVYVSAWTEPSTAPPGSNVAAPLNTSGTGQSKAGGLILNTGGAANGLIVDQGDVGIGTATPSAKLDVVGNIQVDATSDVCIDGGSCLSTAGGGWNPSNYAGEESITFPNGIIMKAGTVNSATFWGYHPFSFGTPFPNGVVTVLASGAAGAALFIDRNDTIVSSFDLNGFTVWGYGGSYRWLAIGY
jgi:hypothetical protein